MLLSARYCVAKAYLLLLSLGYSYLYYLKVYIMHTINRENNYDTLVNSLEIIIDDFMMATDGTLTGIEARTLQAKLEAVLLDLRHAKG